MIILETLLQIAMHTIALLMAVVLYGVFGYTSAVLFCEIRERWLKK